MLAWNISQEEESGDSDGVVTISSEDEGAKETDKKKENAETVKPITSGVMKEWSTHIEALNKAIH